MKKSLLVSGASKVDPNEIYRNDFETLDGIELAGSSRGQVTTEDAIGTVTLDKKALTLKWDQSGYILAKINLNRLDDIQYVQFYMSVTDVASETSYGEVFLAYNSTNFGSEAFTVECNITNQNNITLYKRQPGNTYFGQRFPSGYWQKVGLKIDNVNLTVDIYNNDTFVTQSSIQASRPVQWLVFGGEHTPGFKMQIQNVTVNTANFSKGVRNSDGIGEYSTNYVYPTMDASIDASNFTGKHKEPYDPDGGTNYIDGPKRYSDNFDSQYSRLKNAKFLYKRGSTMYQKDLATSNKISFLGNPTTSDINYTVDSYGSGDKAIIKNAIKYEGSWTVYDASNNVYRSDVIPNISNLASVMIPNIDAFGLRQSTDLLDFNTKNGIYFKDTNTILVKLFDGSDPSLSNIELGSDAGYLVNFYCTVQNIHFQIGGLTSPKFGITQNCDFSLGSGSQIENSTFRYNVSKNNWRGGDYGESTLGGGSAPFKINNDAVCVYNVFEDNYIGLQLQNNVDNTLIAFNIIKNAIVNHLQISALSGNGDPLKPLIIANNTILHSPRHAQDIPYPLVIDQPGHGFVHQLGGGANYIFVNNLMLLHYNSNITVASVMNLQSQINTNAISKTGYNRYYMTPISTTPSEIFNRGSGNDLSSWSVAFGAYGDNLDIDGVSLPDSTSSVVNTLPVVRADATPTSGKWDETDATPTVTGDGYEFDFSQWGLTVDGSGNPLTSSRNIGAY